MAVWRLFFFFSLFFLPFFFVCVCVWVGGWVGYLHCAQQLECFLPQTCSSICPDDSREGSHVAGKASLWVGGWVGGWVGCRWVVLFSGFRMTCWTGWEGGWVG